METAPQQQGFATVSAPAGVVVSATSTGQTYMQGTTASSQVVSQRHPLTHTTRASPATVSIVDLGSGQSAV